MRPRLRDDLGRLLLGVLDQTAAADLRVVADALGLVARLFEVSLSLVELAAGRLELGRELALDPVAPLGQRGLEVGRCRAALACWAS